MDAAHGWTHMHRGAMSASVSGRAPRAWMSIKSALIVTDNSKTSNSRARVALMGAKTTVTMPYYARIVLDYI